MPTTKVLVALMRKWPMNNAVLVAVTHRRFGKVADGTGTRVVTCTINRWRAKINWKGIYNVRNPPRKREGEWEGENMIAIYMILETFVTERWKKNKNNKSSKEMLEDRISYFSPRPCYSTHSQPCLVVVTLTKT